MSSYIFLIRGTSYKREQDRQEIPITKQHLTHVKVPREHFEAYCIVKNVVIPEWKSNKEAVIVKMSFFHLFCNTYNLSMQNFL